MRAHRRPKQFAQNNHSYDANLARSVLKKQQAEETMDVEDSFELIGSKQQRERDAVTAAAPTSSTAAGPKAAAGATSRNGGVVPDDLTNLNWVSGIPVPMNTSVSPPEGSRNKKLFFGSPSTKDLLQHQEVSSQQSTPSVPTRTKALKTTTLPTYKIVVKDSNYETSGCYSPSSSNQSPEKRDSVILASIVASGGQGGGVADCCHSSEAPIPVESEKITIEDECCIDLKNGTVSTKCVVEDSEHNKPNCSYTCLIGMALKASNGCLPVNAIYQYIE